MSEGVMYTHWVLGTAKCVLFMKPLPFQGVLIRGFHCIYSFQSAAAKTAFQAQRWSRISESHI